MMMLIQPEKRIKELRALIDTFSYEYHMLDSPTVDDAVYDSLFSELKSLEVKYPELITTDSPTQRVGNELSGGFKKAEHSTRMLSLNDVFDKSEVESWVKRIDKLLPGRKHEFFADIKMDGLACALIYQDGLLVRAITRGNSFVGEDVTDNVRTIKNIPLRLRSTVGFEKFSIGRTEVRGEIVMLKKDFARLNKKRLAAGEPEFANPRNLAAGTIRQLDPKLVAARPLHFRAYDLLRDDSSEVPTNMSAYQTLSAIGITRNLEADIFTTLNGVMKFVDIWDKKRNELPFNTDGLVIKVNDRAQYVELGIVGKQPRAAVAYKYMAEKATTIVRDIRKDIRIGDTVVIFKAGDIIPQVDSVVLELRPKDSSMFDFEKALSEQLPEYKFERSEGEVVYRAKGMTGPILLARALQHFASKGALDIDTLGEKNVIALVESGLVNNLADIYSLRFEQVIKLDRFANISARKLVDAIQAAKKPTLERFIYGLGIRHVGIQTAIDLANRFESIKTLRVATIDDLQQVEGVGEVVAESIVAWFADPDNESLLRQFERFMVQPYFKKSSGKLLGMSFVVTGTLESMSREEVGNRVRALGGIFQSAVAKDTTYLVVGDKVGGSKLKKAQSYTVKIINELQLKEILGN